MASFPTAFRVIAPVTERIVHSKTYFELALKVPEIARAAQPGQFINVAIPPQGGFFEDDGEDTGARSTFLLRRPLSVYRVEGDEVRILFKIFGRGTALLARARRGDRLDVIGPLGHGVEMDDPPFRRAILAGGGIGIPPLVFLADRLRPRAVPCTVIFGAESRIPMKTAPARPGGFFEGLGVTRTLPEFEFLGCPVGLSTDRRRKGYHHGFLTTLLSAWLESRPEEEKRESEIFACGPVPMLGAVARIAAEHRVTCQVLMEERMACGLGACRACVCEVRTAQGEVVNQRVCTEGPAFFADRVVWDQ